MIEPIKPDEVVGKKTDLIPDEVIESFNEMIAKKWNGTSSRFKQNDIVSLILSRMNGSLRGTIVKYDSRYLFDNNLLDVEDIYREQGWKVDYDKPGYNESYSAIFEFSK